MRHNIRQAEARDFLAVSRTHGDRNAALLQELGRGELSSITQPIFRERYVRHIARADTESLVVEEQGQVVGFLSMEFRERLNRSNREAWVPDLIVNEASRGRGLGRALLQAAFEIAREQGCYRLTLESGHDREIAHHLYLATGMREEGSFFGINLKASGLR